MRLSDVESMMPGHTLDRRTSLERLRATVEAKYPQIVVEEVSYHDLECYWLRANYKNMRFHITHEILDDDIMDSLFGEAA